MSPVEQSSVAEKESGGGGMKEVESLISSGVGSLAQGDAAEAVTSLAKATELVAELFGPTAPESFQAHLEYGRALLELSRSESQVFTTAVENLHADDDSDEDTDMKVNKEETKGTKNKDENSEGEAKTAEKEAEGEEKEEGDGKAEGEDGEEMSNIQLAWEILEVARTIATGQEGSEWRLQEMETLSLLAEVQIEDEKYEEAVGDLNALLKLQAQILPESDDRRMAETHFQIARAYNLDSDFDSAASSYNNALNLIQARLNRLKGSGNDKEVEELGELVPEIQAKVEDALESAASLAEKLNSVRSQLGLPTTTLGFQAKGAMEGPASDIAHLVRKPIKRAQPETEPSQVMEAKKAKTEEVPASPEKTPNPNPTSASIPIPTSTPTPTPTPNSTPTPTPTNTPTPIPTPNSPAPSN